MVALEEPEVPRQRIPIEGAQRPHDGIVAWQTIVVLKPDDRQLGDVVELLGLGRGRRAEVSAAHNARDAGGFVVARFVSWVPQPCGRRFDHEGRVATGSCDLVALGLDGPVVDHRARHALHDVDVDVALAELDQPDGSSAGKLKGATRGDRHKKINLIAVAAKASPARTPGCGSFA